MSEVCLTYKYAKEDNGWISVCCLDFPLIATQGKTKEELKENVISLTEWCLQMQRDGELHESQQMKITKHKYSKNYFRLTFDAEKCKLVKDANFRNFDFLAKTLGSRRG